MTENVTVQYTVLFTAQKTKKFKTWQDGTMKYYSSNKKLILTDEKGYNIDRKFCKSEMPSVGDEIEFDGHIVTIEACDGSIQTAPRIDEPRAHMARMPPVKALPTRIPTTSTLSSRNLTTSASPTSASPTSAPPTSVPPTSVPPTSVPPTSVPPTSVPPTSVPPTSVPPTSASPRSVPSISVSPISVSLTSVPSAGVPTTGVPSTSVPSMSAPLSAAHNMPSTDTPKRSLSSRFVSPLKRKQRLISMDPEEMDDSIDMADPVTTTFNAPIQPTTSNITTLSSVDYASPKKQRFGLSRSNVNNANLSNVIFSSFTKASNITESVPDEPTSSTPSRPFKSPFVEGVYTSAVLQFPSSRKALTTLKTKKYPKRTKVVPTKFSNLSVYRETFKKIIYEHLEILLLNYSIYFFSIYEKYASGKQGYELEKVLRYKGLGMYVDCEIKSDSRYQQDTRYRLTIRNKEHYSKYGKDDIWVVSKSPSFESSQTFLARSVFFGPFSNNTLEVDCVSSRDSRVASKIMSETREVYALRTISASTEFMMLDTLDDKLENLPILRYILGEKQNKKETLPSMDCIQLRRDDFIDMDARLKETVRLYKLNADQESVLRRVASSVITAPGWNEGADHPVVLVHGVYGSGKSFLAAVIIIFIEELIEKVNKYREPEDQIQFKILVSSMTNVAVDRILQTLLKLGYDHFIRIGSMKKIAKNILPFTAKARLSSNEELKELEQMLDDGQNSEEDMDNISTAIQHFRKSESVSQIHTAHVVGTTFMSSVFEIFNDIKFPLILVDESSQLMEPLTMVPLTRFSCNRLVMIGDPLQLPPTLVSPSEENKIGKGLDKTLFDRLIEMGYESIMLRTQYRCHPKISAISNKLFYDRRLLNGVTVEERKPLLEGLPTVVFIDVGGMEQKSARTNSFWNENEVSVAVYIIQSMKDLNISLNDMGVISLYKEQADKLSDRLNATGNTSLAKSIQISTVDAFQGGEKDVIILSTVRTTESAFMHNEPRINVALTRAKRHLIILGNRNMLTMNELWSKVIWDCEENVMTHQSFASLLQSIQINQ